MSEDNSAYWEQRACEEVPDVDTIIGGPVRKNKMTRAPGQFRQHQFTTSSCRLGLDAPCGYGKSLIPLAMESQVVGLDLSISMLKRCKLNLKTLHLQSDLIRGDLRALPFRPQTFDAALCLNSLYVIKPKYWLEILEGFNEVLVNGGELDFNLRMRSVIWSAHYAFGLFVALARVIYEIERFTHFVRLWDWLGFRRMRGNYVFFATSGSIKKILHRLPMKLIKAEGVEKRTFVLQRPST